MANLGNPPENLKSISYFFKMAEEHQQKYLPLSYWCYIYALKTGLQINKKSENKEATAFFHKIIEWLEKTKTENADVKPIVDDDEAKKYVTGFANKYYNFAQNKENSGITDKTVVKAYYNTATLIDVLSEFGEVDADMLEKQKSARYKMVAIQKGNKAADESDAQNGGSSSTTETGSNREPKNENDADEEKQADDDGSTNPTPDRRSSSETESPHSPPPAPPVTPMKQETSSTPSSGFTIPSSSNVSSTQRETDLVSDPESSTSNTPAKYTAPPPDKIKQAKKLCKFAESALNFDDIPTSIANLESALKILKELQLN